MMIKKLGIILIILISISSIAFANPTDKIQDLESKLSRVEDKEKVDILNQLAELYMDISPDKTISYGKEALMIAEKNRVTEGIVDSHNSIGMGYFILSNYEKALEEFSQSRSISEESYDKGLATALNGMGLVFNASGSYQEAKDYFADALKLFEAIDDKKGIAYALNNIGAIHDTLLMYHE